MNSAQFRLRQVQVSRAVRCHGDEWGKHTCKNSKHVACCHPPSCVLWIYTLRCISRMTCKCLSRGRVSNCYFTILCQWQVPHKHCKHKLNTCIPFLPSPPLGPISWFLIVLSIFLIFFFFCCSSVPKNVIENKLTGQTTLRFPLTRSMWNDMFGSRPQKALDLRKELDYRDSMFQFNIWTRARHKMSPNSCIMRRPFGSLLSSLLACSARFWRYWYRHKVMMNLGTRSPSYPNTARPFPFS